MKSLKILSFLLFSSCCITPIQPIAPTTEQKASLSDEEYLDHMIKQYNLTIPERLFKYAFDTEIHASTLTESFELDPAIDEYARKKHIQLNNSPFFDISFILQPEKVRNYQTKPKIYKENVGQLVTFTTEDNIELKGTYFDRGSDTLVVIGPGFTNEREKLAPFTHLFAEYDVVFFDYRGHGFEKTILHKPSTWNMNMLRYFFGIDPAQARLGLEEEKDVCAVIRGMKQRKNYKKVAGLGICYSALIFIKAASIYPDLFTHVIADGCWLSLSNFTDKLSHDLKMLCSPQRGGWRSFWLTTKEWGRDLIKNTSESLFQMKFKSVSVLDYLPHLDSKLNLLFFQGKNDLVISRQEFETIWSAAKVDHKTAIITSNPHVWNHLKQKELYKLVCDLFLTHDHEAFVSSLQDKEVLLHYENNHLMGS